ncbi:MAG: alpha/beta fold hydrolase [Polyangiaceae bacterium]
MYDIAGRGELPTTVLLHGLGSSATAFAPFARRLRSYVGRIVAPDYPGHGFSGEHAALTPERLFESVEQALEKLVDEPAILVGNSLGGAVALHLAIAHPERVRALVLVSPAGAPSSAEEWEALRSTFALENRADARAFIDRLYHRPPWLTHLVAHELPHLMQRRAVKDLLRGGANEHFASPDQLRALKMPVLLLWGESERLLPDSHLAYFRRHLPSHALIERPRGFGHCPHLDAPAALASRIAAFAKQQLQ